LFGYKTSFLVLKEEQRYLKKTAEENFWTFERQMTKIVEKLHNTELHCSCYRLEIVEDESKDKFAPLF
jgi:hypothetical protein